MAEPLVRVTVAEVRHGIALGIAQSMIAEVARVLDREGCLQPKLKIALRLAWKTATPARLVTELPAVLSHDGVGPT